MNKQFNKHNRQLQAVIQLVLVAALLIVSMVVRANTSAEAFIVRDIEVHGLHALSENTVLNYVPVHRGQTLGRAQATHIIHELYKTGFFDDVRVKQRGSTLLLWVSERPVLGAVNVSGASEIPKKDLTKVLDKTALKVGHVYNPAKVATAKEILMAHYQSLGFQQVVIDADTQKQADGRLALTIVITEHQVTKINAIRFSGNQHFSDFRIRRQLKLSSNHILGYLLRNDRYSDTALDMGIERLRDFYFDHGYVQFEVSHRQVQFSKNHKSVSIALTLHEGPVFHIGHLQVNLPKAAWAKPMEKLIFIHSGDRFSKVKLQALSQSLARYLGNRGYAHPNIHMVPKINYRTATLDIQVDVNPGRRYTVRRVTFSGHDKTSDQVLRQTSALIEGQLYSQARVEEGKRRLANLGYLSDIQVTQTPVLDQLDALDVHYKVKESSSATASAEMGYSDRDGLLYSVHINQKNLLGTGRILSIDFNHSEYERVYSVSYTNPFYTTSGISSGIQLYDRRVTPGRTNISSFAKNIVGGGLRYGIPISPYASASLGFGYDRTKLILPTTEWGRAPQIDQFVQRHGKNYDDVNLHLGLNHGTYNRAVFPTMGISQNFGVGVGLPAGKQSLNYYLLNYTVTYYHPLIAGFIGQLHGDFGYGRGYGKTGVDLPFFKNFYAGGLGSVRGYLGNSLGPRDVDDRALGGNVLGVGSVGLVLPQHLGSSASVRTTLFLDAGNVFYNRFQPDELRYATGVTVEWNTGFLPLVISWAKPLSHRSTDQRERFQFTIGTNF